MSLEKLQRDWEQLLGEDGMQLVAGDLQANDLPNILNTYALDKGLKGGSRYLFSSVFDCCGLIDVDRFNLSPVLVEVMQRSVSAAMKATASEGHSSVLVALSPYKSFGGEVTRAKHGYLVLVSPVTFSFCFLYAVLAVTSAQATGLLLQGLVARDESGSALIDPFEWAYLSHRALGSTVQEFLETGTVADPQVKVAEARFDLLPWHYIERVQRTYEQMLDFLVLHEFGHICLGHMRSIETVRRVVPSTSISYEVADPKPSQEEEADDFALRCLVGVNNSDELAELTRLLDEGDFRKRELDKLWMGRTCLGRYTSALQLLKLFDRFDYHLTQKGHGTRFTEICEINGTHPSGQHRFIRAWGASQTLLAMPAGRTFNIGNIISWSNWVNLDAAQHTADEVRQHWKTLNSNDLLMSGLYAPTHARPAG